MEGGLELEAEPENDQILTGQEGASSEAGPSKIGSPSKLPKGLLDDLYALQVWNMPKKQGSR